MTIEYGGKTYDCADEFSLKDFTTHSFGGAKLDGLTIYASCFSKEQPDSRIFPDDMTGATFIKCNLDNIFIPDGNEVIDCSQRRFEVQKDARDWIIDENDDPVSVTAEKSWEARGFSVDPDDIPVENPINTEEMSQKTYETEFVGENVTGHPIFIGVPKIISQRTVRSTFFVVEKEDIENLGLSNVVDITKKVLATMNDEQRAKLSPGTLILEADIEFVTVQGEGRMYNNVEKQLAKV